MTAELLPTLETHRGLCQTMHAVMEQEAACLARGDLAGLPEVDAARREMLPRLQEVASRLKEHRLHWERQPAEQRALPPETQALLQETQEWLQRLLTLDRDNERARLRHGLVPLQHLPPAPPAGGGGYVAEKYRRQGLG